MYDLEGEKESGKCANPLKAFGVTSTQPPEQSEVSSPAQQPVKLGHLDTAVIVQRNRGPWVRAAELAQLFRSWDLAYRCTRAGWLKPVVQGKRRTIYRLADVLACMQRIEAGELPLPRRRKSGQ